MSFDTVTPVSQPARRSRIFTGFLDRHCERIHVGDLIWSGMRRGYAGGWTVEKVVRGDDGLFYLADPKTGEKMDMQYDQELRELIHKSEN